MSLCGLGRQLAPLVHLSIWGLGFRREATYIMSDVPSRRAVDSIQGSGGLGFRV